MGPSPTRQCSEAGGPSAGSKLPGTSLAASPCGIILRGYRSLRDSVRGGPQSCQQLTEFWILFDLADLRYLSIFRFCLISHRPNVNFGVTLYLILI